VLFSISKEGDVVASGKSALKRRDLYLNRLVAFQDTEPVKIVTGIRRCGKSSLMKLMAQHLREQNIADDQIIELNFESMQYRSMDAAALYQHVQGLLPQGKRAYLFFDEIQLIPAWQDAVNSLRVDTDCDIYITGSNAHLLSGEFSTYLAGRHVEINMLPLSFQEFLYFHGYTVARRESPSGGTRKHITNSAGEQYTPEELLQSYLTFGGMPGLADVGLDQEKAMTLLDGIYATVVMRDILEREARRGQRRITDPLLLRKIILFLADSIGSNTSMRSIGNTLVSEGMLDDRSRKGSPAVQTIQAYVAALTEAYVFYDVKRYDIKGKEYLRTLGKYYIVDLGLRNYLLGFRDMDRGHALENLVYFELLRQGWDVAIGKIGDKEVDFVATKPNQKRYLQVTEHMQSEQTRQREFSALRRTQDSHQKLVIALHSDVSHTEDGIRIMKLTDFLLADAI